MNIATLLSRQGRRLLQLGVVLLLFTAVEGFAIPYFAVPMLGLSVHRLGALEAVLLLAMGLLWSRLDLGPAGSRTSGVQEAAIDVVAYSSAPTGLIAFALVLWGLRASTVSSGEGGA